MLNKVAARLKTVFRVLLSGDEISRNSLLMKYWKLKNFFQCQNSSYLAMLVQGQLSWHD